MLRNEIGFCDSCKTKKKLWVKDLCRPCYNYINKDRIRQTRRLWEKRNPEKVSKNVRDNQWDDLMFGGNRQLALERDNFECQRCGMTQEKHFILFNRGLSVHHKDGKGIALDKGEKNNELDNLITLCMRCHGKLHREEHMINKYGSLLEQNESNWKYPNIRKLVNTEIKKGFGIQESKRIVSKNTKIGFSSIDHKYYDIKIKNTKESIK